MNSIVIIGRLTKDVEVRYIPASGKAMATFGVAVNRTYKEKDGSTSADFFNVVVFGKLAENCGNYLAKGSLVGVHGQSRNSTYEVNGEKRYKNEIVADTVQFLDSKKNNASTDDGYLPVDEIPPFY